jgi:hypothetical protein
MRSGYTDRVVLILTCKASYEDMKEKLLKMSTTLTPTPLLVPGFCKGRLFPGRLS